MNTEIEAKFLNVSPHLMRNKLQTLGFTCTVPNRLMNRATLHKAGQYRNIHEWWRVRDEGTGIITMTWKHNEVDAVDGTRELEIQVSDFETAVQFLITTGLELVARQESRRETWTQEGIEVVIDEWPGLNPFIEIEGASVEAVTKAAHDLGFDMKDAVFGASATSTKSNWGMCPRP
jgi:adenylate cyclase, class 2